MKYKNFWRTVVFIKQNASFYKKRFVLCPEQDLNLHTLKSTWPSTMLVYQFQHPGSIDMQKYIFFKVTQP